MTTYDFQAAYHAIINFVVVDLSSLYIDVARDRLYCDGRRLARAPLGADRALPVLDALVRMLAPLIPFTADEIYSHMPGERAESVHLLTLVPADPRVARRGTGGPLGTPAQGAGRGAQAARDDAPGGDDRCAA